MARHLGAAAERPEPGASFDQFEQVADTASLCVSLPSPVEFVTVTGSIALALGCTLLVIARLMRTRAARIRAQKFGGSDR